MATNIFKNFTDKDVVSGKNPLYESVPISGSLISGTYLAGGGNIVNYSHDYFQSVYDYSSSLASANHLFDISIGYLSGSSSFEFVNGTSHAKKVAMYNQMAQVLVGYDTTGSVLPFDRDGDFAAGGDKITEAYFLCFSRLLTKDEIKKGTFSITLGASGSFAAPYDSGTCTFTDAGAATSYFVNSPAGEYGLLTSASMNFGLVYYQAGVVVLNASASFMGSMDGYSTAVNTSSEMDAGRVNTVLDLFGSASITGSCDALRRRIQSISFNNTTELNSTIYFCRADHGSFNYSSNPTYLTGSKIRVKQVASDMPVTYITGVGLYGPDGSMLATAKLSEPLAKDFNTELLIKTRLDF